MRVEGREMAARTRRDPAAEGRVLEALREMPQGQPVRLQLRLQGRAEGAGLDAGGARGAVDLDDPPQMAQIEADRGLVAAVEACLDAADDAAAAAERDDCGLLAAGPVDDCGDLRLVARIGDQVGSIAVIAGEGADVVAV